MAQANAHESHDANVYYVPHGSRWPVVASVALACVQNAHALVVEEHAAEVRAKADALTQRNLARQAIDEYEVAVGRLQRLAANPELSALRESVEYRELLEQMRETKAEFPDAK